MIQSMTGFGQCELAEAGWRCHVEMRSVNGRYLDIRARFPAGLGHLEDPFKRQVKAQCPRGKIEVSITLLPDGAAGSAPRVNRPLLQAYRSLLEELETALGRPVQVSLGDLTANRELIGSNDWGDDPGAVETLLQRTLELALDDLVSMRVTEGAALGKTLAAQLAAMRRITEKMAPLAGDLPEVYAEKLRENLKRLGGGEMVADERIIQEIALFAERCDVTEEFERLKAHFDHLDSLLESGGQVGKKIDFLLQEMNREVNTLGVKSNHLRMSPLVIEIKSAIEKLREQTQNIV